ncbi:MAG: hypothetical protein J6K17_08475 [Oscillospiraceae bacterium]|nr:hypothetical protein [Oscillospiraceae bacterium]
MKLTTKIITVLISALMLCGCSENESEKNTPPETEIVSLADVTMAETIAVPTETTITTTTAEETTTTSETTTPEPITEINNESLFPDIDYEALANEFYESIVEVGNEASGYISVYPDWIYEEYENGDYDVYSPDGINFLTVATITDLEEMDLLQTAYTTSYAVVLNSEIDGYESYTVSDVTVGNLAGYYSIMMDYDSDLGFIFYLALCDEETHTLRTVIAASSDMSLPNVSVVSMMFDTYHP